MQVDLPFAFDGERALLDAAATSHRALLSVLAGDVGAEERRVERIARWADEFRPWLGWVVIEDGEVASFTLWQRVEAFFEYQPELETDAQVLRRCADALRVAVAALR